MLTTTVFGFKKPQTSDPVTALRTGIGDNADLLEAALLSAGGARGIVPVGTVLDYAGSGDPSTSYLVIDGRSLLRASYTVLFGLIGTTYGAADGTHFNLPDGRGRVIIGAGTGAGLTARSLAATLGAETHTHDLSNHAHETLDSIGQRAGNIRIMSPGNNPNYSGSIGGYGTRAFLTVGAITAYELGGYGNSDSTEVWHEQTSAPTNNTSGSQSSYQPSLALNKIIRVL